MNDQGNRSAQTQQKASVEDEQRLSRRCFITTTALAAAGTIVWGIGTPRAAIPTTKRRDSSDSIIEPVFLPMFPLPMVAFPGEEIPLHIFEPRYKQLIGECRENDSGFGITPILKGRIAPHGTEVGRLTLLKTYDTGEMDVLVRGLRVFRLESFRERAEPKPFPGGRITPLRNDPESDPAIENKLLKLFHELHALLQSNETVADPEPANLSFMIGHKVSLALGQKVEMIAMAREAQRQSFMVRHLERLIPRIEEDRAKSKPAGDSA